MVLVLQLVAVGSKVVSAGGGHSGLVNGDNGAVGVGNQTVEASGVAGTVGDGGAGVDTAKHTVGGQVVGTGGNHSGLVSGGHSAVGVGNQGGNVDGGGVSGINSGSGGKGRGSGESGGRSNGGSCGNHRGSGGIDLSLGSQVVGTGGGNSGLINGDNSAVGVANKSIAVASSITVASTVGIASSIAVSGTIGNSSGSGSNSVAKLGCQMVSFGGGHTGLVEGGDGAVGVTLEAVESLAGSSGNTGGKNLKDKLLVKKIWIAKVISQRKDG